jgi:YebC/PmpR family DNA-binding regulatory protein
MAGHSKWANIRFRKGLQDAKRGKIFTKLIREISVAARTGGSDEAANARLRDAVTKALKANMKRDTIDNAIKRGAGDSAGDAMQEMRYEGYGPAGVAIIVDCLSDNKNRTVSEVRHAFTKHGGNLGTDGSVSYLFSKQGQILLAPTENIEKAMEVAIDAGALDIEEVDGQLEITTEPEMYHNILTELQKADFEVENSDLTMQASVNIPISEDVMISLEKLIDTLEDLDDVQAVYNNAQYPDS